MQPIIMSAEPQESPKLQQLRQKFQEQIAALVKDAEALARDEQLIKNTGAADLTEKHLVLLRDIPIRKLNLLRRELAIRQELADKWFPAIHADRGRARDEAFEAHEKACQDVRAELMKIGYVEGMIPDTEIPCITDDMISRHPKVRAAFSLYRDLYGRVNDESDRRVNSESLREVEHDMERAKHRALHTVM